LQTKALLVYKFYGFDLKGMSNQTFGTSLASYMVRTPRMEQSTALQTATIRPTTAQPTGAVPARAGDVSASTVAPTRDGVNSTSIKRL
jgi:hypothetical protein